MKKVLYAIYSSIEMKKVRGAESVRNDNRTTILGTAKEGTQICLITFLLLYNVILSILLHCAI
jgi:hypothetical protein